ncbi:TPA: phosphodiesterase [Vibrio parahaemolyticus]|uniref:phosphodiesterase n=1 Tax=Vibrio parahaemolyticus TaxID=670 RepID=UPI001121238D|nr:phosphodiesterase [Vibrio parahaemolyticus]MDF4675036.1 phosphodiesterase [Vibrio parahaemolyticus]MDF4699288.1 phosphodiesterase [Vibrio parahaemolyticus]TON08347.1 YfcE family phosphodiesterase [Vibrio parahaemolyticus]TOO39990.1 YfcE family phosphodiesterase [Vibrio parahaemolyticus]TOP27078.1 YfcE family phosphodiesterase [Vibrio parahaemolyticus]
MKLFFASDLHGSLPATEETIKLFLASGAEHLVLLGDTLNHGPRNPIPEGYNPPQVAELLNQYSQQIISVRGNCDSEVDQMLLNFPMMMDYAWVLLESGKRIFLTHGHLYNSDKRPPLREGDIIAHGHTHVPVAEMKEGVVIFNPGSMTFPRNGLPRSFGLLDGNTLSVQTPEGEVLVQTTI